MASGGPDEKPIPPASRSKTTITPLKKVTKALSRANDKAARVVRRAEVHFESFDTEDARRDAIFGYTLVLGVNLVSCISLGLYAADLISPVCEINCELVMVLIKWVLEAVTGKMSFPLIVHHVMMVMALIWLQKDWTRCYLWLIVHAQLVHVPFALRALWRLMMPSLRCIPPSLGWMREVVDALFWATWMVTIGYRSLLICTYCMWATWATELSWDASGMPFGCGLGLAVLDIAWTNAMWPKPDACGPTLVLRAGGAFAVGVMTFVWIISMDLSPEYLGQALSTESTRHCVSDQFISGSA